MTAAITAGRMPRTGRSRPSKPSSAMKTFRPVGRMSLAASSTAMAIDRSKPDPRLGKEAGIRFAVILRRLSGMPEFCAAERIRSFASLSEASGRPRMTKAGRVWPMSASTSTM